MEGIDLSALNGDELQQKVEEIVQQRVQAELEANRINEGEVTYAQPSAGNPVPPTGNQPSPSSQGKPATFNDPSSVAHIVAQAAKATAEAIAFNNRALPAQVGMLCIPVFEGNQGEIQLAQNPISKSNSKHMDTRHHFLRELVERKEISAIHVPSPYQRADFLTKSLPKDTFESHHDL